ncbi:hypothetical protein D3C84_992680 [compost metagenome]
MATGVLLLQIREAGLQIDHRAVLGSQLDRQLISLLGEVVQLLGQVIESDNKGTQQIMRLGQFKGFNYAISRVHYSLSRYLLTTTPRTGITSCGARPVITRKRRHTP